MKIYLQYIIVSVEAPEGAFPSGTELRITPITAEKQVAEIKDSLIENTDVTEDSKAVSFDISFIYTMPNGEEVELQPNEGYKVKVAFNYIKDEGFRQVEESEDRELKIYHLEGVKEESGDISVQEVETNEKESSGGELVVDAEKFSVYTIVDQMVNFTYEPIVICNPNDFEDCMTVMDRNLGAISNVRTSTGSYGYHYQWGNNYGFTIGNYTNNSSYSYSDSVTNSSVNVSSNGAVWNDSYNNNGYYGTVFIKSSNTNSDYWSTTTLHNDLRGGGNDSSSNSRGATLNNPTDRQGPCPTGWHVPSAGERSNLLNLFISDYNNENSSNVTLSTSSTYSNLYQLSNTTAITSFINYFKIPYAGSRRYSDALLGEAGNYARYFSSTPGGSNTYNAAVFSIASSSIQYYASRRAYGDSVRCFKDETLFYPLISFYDYNNDVVGSGRVKPTKKIPTSYIPEMYDEPGYHFIGWYESGTNNEFDFNKSIEEDTDIVAGYECTENYHKSGNICEINTYTVTWKNRNGTILETDSGMLSGSMPSYDGPAPERPGDGTYLYTFDGWNPNISIVTGDIEYTARFISYESASEYLIKFVNNDGTVLQSGMVKDGIWPVYTGATPTRTGEGYTYIFSGWTPAISIVSKPATYIARYDSVADEYLIQFLNYDGTLLQGSILSYGEMPEYVGDAPVKPSDGNYDYVFNNDWTPEISLVTGATVYTAVFMQISARGWQYDTWREGTNYDGIIVTGSDQCITIMDRNLGATSNNISNSNSYGTYFQRGNGYGFTTSSNTSSSRVNVSSYGASKYQSSTFIRYNNNNYNSQWMSSMNSNLWGGGADTSSNNYGQGQTNFADRQGPCPAGWHIPSAYEWSSVNRYWNTYKGNQSSTTISSSNRNTFRSELKIPYNGYLGYSRNNGLTVSNGGNYAYLYTSSPYNSNAGVTYRGYNGFQTDTTNYTSRGEGLRCFKNSYSCPVCVFNGQTVADGDSVTAYQSASVPYGSSCVSQTRTCSMGSLNGSYSYSTCTVQEPANCTFEMGEVAHGTNVTAYQSASVPYGSSCVSQTRTCNNGILSGTYEYPDCIVEEPTTCEFQGQTIENGDSLTVYSSSSETCPDTCTPGTVTCTNGELGGDLSYTSTSCTVSPVYCSASLYPLESCPNHGICSQCTGYTTNGISCTIGTTIFALDSCETHYHKNGNVCDINVYTATITSNNNASGTVSPLSVTGSYGSTITVNGNTITIGGKTVTATPTTDTAEYDYEFLDWTNTCGNTLTGNCTITANFTSTKNQYTATISSNNNEYGSVSPTSVTKDYGSTITVNGSTITIGGTTVTAIPSTGTTQYTYAFSGWINSCGILITGDCTIQAEFTRTVNKYLIQFVNGDDVLQSGMIEYGQTPSYTGATPEKTGNEQYSYVFSGWSPEIHTVTEAQVYNAEFSVITNKYTVIITSNNDYYGSVIPTSVTKDYGSSIIESGNTITIGGTIVTATPMEDTAQYDYEFVGWINSCGNTLTGACSIIANFTKSLKSYTVTFDSKGGNYTPNSQTIVYGYLATRPGIDPNKTGYDFNNWSLNGQYFDFNTQITGDITLYAERSRIEYYITYRDGEDILDLTPKSYTIEDNILTLPIPTKIGYIFSGWYENGNLITSIPLGSYGDKELQAEWTPRTDTPYTVEYYLENLDDDKYTLIETETLRGTTDTQTNVVAKNYTGFTLVGNISQYQTTIKGDGSTIVELYYTRNIYEIIFLNDGELEILGSGMYKYGTPVEDIEVPENPERESTQLYEYEFDWWYPELEDVTTGAIYMATYRAKAIPQISFVNPTPEDLVEWNQNRFTTKVEISNIDRVYLISYIVDGHDSYNGFNIRQSKYGYNFNDIEELGENTNDLVKSFMDENDGEVYGAIRVSNGRYGGAYSFDGIDDFIYLNSPFPSATCKSCGSIYIEYRAKPEGGEWTHVIVGGNDVFVNGKSVDSLPDEFNCVVNIGSSYIGKCDEGGYFTGLIDEVRVYMRSVLNEEVPFLYKSNLRKTSGDVREFETVNTCLLASGIYDYSINITSDVWTNASTGRTLTTNIPLVSVSGTGYDFGVHETTGESYILSGTMGKLTVTDMIGSGGWLVYLATSESLVGTSTQERISTENMGFKANGLEYSGMYDGYKNTYVSFGKGISTTEYTSAQSECANNNCSGSSAQILEYIIRESDPEDFMCGEVGTYSDNTEVMLEVPAWQVEDEYEGTLWITLQEEIVKNAGNIGDSGEVIKK